MEAKLIVVGGDAKTTEIKLKLPTIIGRGRGATLTLPHPLVSRQHCEIYESEGQLFVRDMGSLNGTFVGNEPITEAALPPGELLTVGAVTFRAIYGALLEQEERDKQEEPPTARRRHNLPTKTIRDAAVETISEPNVGTVKDDRQPRFPPLAARPAANRADPAPVETVWAPDVTPRLPPSAPSEVAAQAPTSTDEPAHVEDEAHVDEEAFIDEAAFLDEQAEIVAFEEVGEEAEPLAAEEPPVRGAAGQPVDEVEELQIEEFDAEEPTEAVAQGEEEAKLSASFAESDELEAVEVAEDDELAEGWEAIDDLDSADGNDVLDDAEDSLEGSTSGSMELPASLSAISPDLAPAVPGSPIGAPTPPTSVVPTARPVEGGVLGQPPMAAPAAPPAATPPAAPVSNNGPAERRWKFTGGPPVAPPATPPAAPLIPPPNPTSENSSENASPAENAADEELKAFLRNLK